MLTPRPAPLAEANAPDLSDVVLHPALEHLVRAGRLPLDDAQRAMLLTHAGSEPLSALLVRLNLLSSAEWAGAVAETFGLRLVTADDFPREPILIETLAARFLREKRVLPIAATDEHVWLATADPTDTATLEAVEIGTGRTVVPVAAALAEIDAAFARLFEGGHFAINRIVGDIEVENGEEIGADVEHLRDVAQDAPVVRLVDQLLTDALRMHASDIHVEPFRDRLRVRFRVHGRLKEITSPPARLAAAVVSRIKIMARLDIAERRLPQDGRARLVLLGRRVDLRVATAPSMHGESLVVRLLDTSAKGVELADLGLDPQVEARLRRQLDTPHGMLLVTGPTGSGKTTTLYASLRILNKDSDKIISIEDPVEYQIDGVTQIQVHAEIGLDFARVLRSVVRHDPDIVMVGETRDGETADIAVHAALTGHLLLSTLHTNNAAGAVARLLDMGIEPYLLASVLRAVIGQRLVGILCEHCKEPHEATAEERCFFTEAGLEVPDPLVLYREKGCPKCDGLGFTGRIGIFELLEVDDKVRELIRTRAPTQAILAQALSSGMRTMYMDGLVKCWRGMTTLEEVCRVTEDW